MRQFWAEIETLPWDEVEDIQNFKLRRQLEYIVNSSEFYRRKFKEAGVKVEKVKGV